MQENEKRQTVEAERQPHILTIEQQKKITLTGVKSVTSFSPQQINLMLSEGKLIITGNNLKVTSFSKSSGTFSADGEIAGVKYNAGGKLSGFFK